MDSELPLPEPAPPPPPPSPPRASVPEPAVMKLTRGHSCVLCQQRKVRCDKQKPCANCVKAQVECRVVPPQPPRRRKKKPHERDLIDRLRKYESLLSQHGVNFEPIAHDLKPSDHGDDADGLEHDLGGLKTSPSSSADHVSPGQGHDKQKWAPPNLHEYRGEDEDSSDEEYEGPTIHNAYDTMFENSDGFPFVVGGNVASVTTAHPSPIQMFQLWQIYISNVEPLLKITHTPTLQVQIISASANPAKIPKPLEALMFAIYFAAITSLTEEEVHTTFSEDRAILLGRYHNATQQALVNAGFMRAPELTVLQALFFYLLCARPYVDPRSMFTLLGMAFRIATRLGLHRDGCTQPDMSPFEAEQRRRLWWQIVIFDKRIAEITGSTVTVLSSCAGDTRMPLNINDTDLNVHAKGQPGPYPGPTEMIFSLTRIELAVAASPDNIRRTVTTPGGRPLHKPMVHYSTSSPDVVSHVANQSLPGDLVAFCSYVENMYLKQCDPKIPLHYFTLLMTRQALCKLRIIDFLCRTANTDNVDQTERDNYFMEALRMVEYDNAIQSSDMLQGFRWYTYAHFPLPAYLCLVSELRHRTTGELCERAWDVMIENHDRRGLLRRLNRNPLHIAFGRYFVKAWDAREAAELQLGRSLPTPKIVALLRATLAKTSPPPPPPPPQMRRPPNGATGMPPQQQQQQQHQHHHHQQQAPVQPIPPGMAITNLPPGITMNLGMYPPPHSSNNNNKPPQSSSAQPPQIIPLPQQQPPPAGGGAGGGGGGTMMIDDAMLYPGYDTTLSGMYGAPTPTSGGGGGGGGGGGSAVAGSVVMQQQQQQHQQEEVVVAPPPAMDWDYLVQVTSLGGFNANGGGFWGQGG